MAKNLHAKARDSDIRPVRGFLPGEVYGQCYLWILLYSDTGYKHLGKVWLNYSFL